MPKTVLNILAIRKIKLRILLDQAPYRNTPQKHKNIIPNTKYCIGRNGTQTATNPITNRQRDGRLSMQRQDTTKIKNETDMWFHWLRDRECHKQFRIYWRPGKANYAENLTKHHPETHHINIRTKFLTPYIILEMMRLEQKQHKSSK